MKNKVFGLDIGATTIKLVWLSHDKSGFFIKAALMYPAPPKGMLSESPFDQDEMVKAIQKIVSDSKITARFVNIALPENQVYTRVIEMPSLSDKELSSAIYWEAEQYIPVPLSQVTLDWKVLKRSNQEEIGSKMSVLLVGAATTVVEKYHKILSMAGLTINAIETEILSAVRALTHSLYQGQEQSMPATLIVHIGAISTSIAIVKGNVIIFSYSLPVGGMAINRALSSDFGFTTSQAEGYKRVYGVTDKILGGKIGKSTEPILSSILVEVKKALSNYSEKHKNDGPIAQVLLSGGTAKLPELDLFFARNLGIETIIANPWKVLATQNVPKDILDNASDYTIAVGLAIRDNE